MPSVFGPVYLVDLRALPRRARQRAAAMVREIETNPEPEGIFKRPAPAPSGPGPSLPSQAGSPFAMQSIATAFVSIACSDSIHEFMCHVYATACCENLVSGRAYKLGDVLTSMDGTTVEISGAG